MTLLAAISSSYTLWATAASLLFGILCWWFMPRGGWPGWLGFLLGYLLLLLGLAIVLVMVYLFPRKPPAALEESRDCASCGQPLEPDRHFCRNCGAKD